MITRGCTGSFYPSHKTSLHRENGERTGRELVAGKKKAKEERAGFKRRRRKEEAKDLCVDSRSDWIYQRQMRSAEAV